MRVSGSKVKSYDIVTMDVLFIETFYGGSHKSFADQWIAHSSHNYHLQTLPPRFWKWRQAGSALFLSESIPRPEEKKFDAVMVSGMIDLGQLKAFRPDLPPAMLYIHENQFAYPLQAGEQRDFRYGLTDLANILSAETAVFNSFFNRDTFFEECRSLFRRLPDAIPRNAVEKALGKSEVIYPGIDIRAISREPPNSSEKNKVPLIIWNHRHEHDKNPETAFRVLKKLSRRKIPFRLALLGERFEKSPPAFDMARRELTEHIVVDDFPGREDYYRWLRRGDIVISTAIQENFGLSVIEAAAAGCRPLLPRRLAYPEVLPLWAQWACLWDNEQELEEKIEKLLGQTEEQRKSLNRPLSRWMEKYGWESQAGKLDSMLEKTAATPRREL